MTAPGSFFRPSERALEFGDEYAAVLARWGELFNAASALVSANVALGRVGGEAFKEFEEWMRSTATMPWSFLTPDMLTRFMGAFKPPASG
jgi:hypothetical protein